MQYKEDIFRVSVKETGKTTTNNKASATFQAAQSMQTSVSLKKKISKIR